MYLKNINYCKKNNIIWVLVIMITEIRNISSRAKLSVVVLQLCSLQSQEDDLLLYSSTVQV